LGGLACRLSRQHTLWLLVGVVVVVTMLAVAVLVGIEQVQNL
jgi:hypothetical protein